MAASTLKEKTAKTLKWNAIDRVSSQLLYAIVGIVLANLLSKEDFGLVGALLIFQSFATLFVDSGFGAALLQLKNPTERDYSTVFWFNLTISIIIYFILFLCAPLIADIFQGDKRLITLSKVMFLTFLINGFAIVQTNRLMKRMDVRKIAISNIIGLIVSGGIGIWLALRGAGPWALVWQSVSLAGVKTCWLWARGEWMPRYGFYLDSIKKIWRIGLSVFSSSGLNILCQNIYNFIIGAFYNLASLGLYTQADKWSKMGTASISQVLTASFIPLLSQVQDDEECFARYIGRINRFTSFLLFPIMIGLAIIGAPLFHLLFGDKWDGAIILYQILTLRGIFIVLIQLFSNHLLSKGYARSMFRIEFIKDVLIVVAILATAWSENLDLLVWGQLISSAVTFVIALAITCRSLGLSQIGILRDIIPFLLLTIIAAIPGWLTTQIAYPTLSLNLAGAIQLVTALSTSLIIYILLARIFKIPELKEAITMVRKKLKK